MYGNVFISHIFSCLGYDLGYVLRYVQEYKMKLLELELDNPSKICFGKLLSYLHGYVDLSLDRTFLGYEWCEEICPPALLLRALVHSALMEGPKHLSCNVLHLVQNSVDLHRSESLFDPSQSSTTVGSCGKGRGGK